MILMVYVGVFLLAYGMYHLIAHLAYFPSVKSGRSISGFWRAMCLELAGYAMKRFSLTSASSGKLKSLLQLNQEKKDETVWLLEKYISSLGVFCLCSPLLLVQPKVFLLCLGAGLFVVWYELLLYCVKSMGDKSILQRELPFFLLLRWKFFEEGRNQAEYLNACQMAMEEEVSKEVWVLLLDDDEESSNQEYFSMFKKIDINDTKMCYKKQFEFFQRKKYDKIDRIFNNRCVKINAIVIIIIFMCFLFFVEIKFNDYFNLIGSIIK